MKVVSFSSLGFEAQVFFELPNRKSERHSGPSQVPDEHITESVPNVCVLAES